MYLLQMKKIPSRVTSAETVSNFALPTGVEYSKLKGSWTST